MRVGIIGTGGMGRVHASQYGKMPDVELFVYDRNPERGARTAANWNATLYSNPAELIEAVDVVDICVPTDGHAELGHQAIAAGRAVFMEKPLAGTLEEAVGLMSAAAAANVPLMPGQVVRFFPDFLTGHQLVKSGAVGTPAAARTRRGGLAPTGSEGWFMDHTRSGGILLDLAIHDFDWLRWTLGEVTQVYSRSLAALTKTGPDYALSTLTFDNGCVAHVESTWMDPNGFRAAFEVAGSAGLIQYDSREAPGLRVSPAKPSEPEVGKSYLAVSQTPTAPLEDPYYLELRGFLDAVKNGTPVPVAPIEGVHAVAIAVAARQSAETGQPVRPAREF